MATARKFGSGSSETKSTSGTNNKGEKRSFGEERKTPPATVGKLKVHTAPPENMPVFMGIYGKEGLGKTSIAAQFPNPVFVLARQEKGLLSLMKKGLVRRDMPYIGPNKRQDDWAIKTVEDLRETTQQLAGSEFDTVIYDSISAFEAFPTKDTINTRFGGNAESYLAYGAGEKFVTQTIWTDFVDDLVDLHANNKNVILLLHEQTRDVVDSINGVSYPKRGFRLSNQFQNLLSRVLDEIILLAPEIGVSKINGTISGKTAEVRGRTMYTNPDDERYLAKSKGLPAEIDMGDSPKEAYKNLMDAIKSRKAAE